MWGQFPAVLVLGARQVTKTTLARRVVFEIKTGEGEPVRAGQRLRSAMTDADARRGFLITQADGVVPLAPGVERRGFANCVDWLPE